MTDQVCPRCKGDGEVPLSASFAGGKSKMCGECKGTGKVSSKPTAPPTPVDTVEEAFLRKRGAGFNGY